MKTVTETKIFEVRDAGTFIPVLAVRIRKGECRPGRLAWRAGYNQPCILLTPLEGGRKACCDAYDHGGRTLPAAHQHIEAHWDTLEDGALIDVRVVLGEAAEPCKTEVGDDEVSLG
jgi:hypothetical protein